MNESHPHADTGNDPTNHPASAWYRSPLVLLGALILVAGLVAIVVTSMTGGDDDVADAADVSTATVDEGSDAGTDVAPTAEPAATLTFGGVGIPESDIVIVDGDALPPLIDPAADTAVGMTAPRTTATSLASGTPIELGPGTARIIGFFAHWCGHCQAELPELAAWLDGNTLSGGAEFIAVSTAVVEDRGNYPPSAWFNAEGWATPVVIDDAEATLLNTYGFSGFPAFIAIDADGVVLDRLSGNIGTAGFERLQAALDS